MAAASAKADAKKKTVAASAATLKKIEKQKAQIAELKLQKKALERKLAKIKALTQ